MEITHAIGLKMMHEEGAQHVRTDEDALPPLNEVNATLPLLDEIGYVMCGTADRLEPVFRIDRRTSSLVESTFHRMS
jgi:hypothetical protein